MNRSPRGVRQPSGIRKLTSVCVTLTGYNATAKILTTSLLRSYQVFQFIVFVNNGNHCHKCYRKMIMKETSEGFNLPVTITVLMFALFSSSITGGVSGFKVFCIIRSPSSCKSHSISFLLEWRQKCLLKERCTMTR